MTDWQKGDLALCVQLYDDAASFSAWPAPRVSPGPIVGLAYTVASVARGYDCFGREGVALQLVEIPTGHPESNGYNSECFVKAEPEESDEFDREVIDLMTGGRVPA